MRQDRGAGSVKQAIGCTVVPAARLPMADVLARSYLRHHPDHDFVVAVIDQAPAAAPDCPYVIAGTDGWEVSEADLLRLATCYSASDLCAALVPFLLTSLLARYPVVTFLGSEALVLGSFDDVVRRANESGVVVLPRVDGMPSSGADEGGVYDSGFLTVGQGAKPVLDEWRGQVVRLPDVALPASRIGPPSIDGIPAISHFDVLRDPGMGAAYWNLLERPLGETSTGAVTAAGEPLKLFNFSGYDPETPWLLSAHCADWPPVLLSESSLLSKLCDDYRARLLESGYQPGTAATYRFGTLGDGTAITEAMRRLFQAEWHAAQDVRNAGRRPASRSRVEVPPHPFGDDESAAFIRWLRSPSSPVESAAGLNRLTTWLWRSRIDLQVAFPDPVGKNAADFRRWCRTHGAAEESLPAWCQPEEPEPPTEPVDELGVNIVGYLTAGLGLGQMGRIVHDVAQRSGVPVSSVSEEQSLNTDAALPELASSGHPAFPISIFAVNADYTESVLATHPDTGYGRYRIGLWAWELEDFPERLHEGFAHVDEVWTVSEFCRDAIAKHAPVPVRTFPVPVVDPGPPTPAPIGPGAAIRFLYLFDFNSTGARKNPWGLVAAFHLAFPRSADVRLVLKATNGDRHPADRERLLRAIGGDHRITLIEDYISDADLGELYRSCHAYVSLHRSEGFGLTVAEAMAHARPVIATDYSSTTELLDDTAGWPIAYRMTAVGPGAAPYPPDGRWADPDLHAAARAMREVADDPTRAARLGLAARERILRTRPMSAAEAWVRERLEVAYATWPEHKRLVPEPSATQLVDEAREALDWRPEVGTAHRNPLAPALRKVVLRAIDHYDVHQRRVLSRLLDGIRDAVELLERQQDRGLRPAERDARWKNAGNDAR